MKIKIFPVGALTSKPYAFISRPWELESLVSIDIFDSLNTSILLNIRSSKVLRILPVINGDVNHDLISNRVRFSNDGFLKQRLVEPLFKLGNVFIPISWHVAIDIFKKNISNSFIEYFFGRVVDRETMMLMYILLSKHYYSSFSNNNFDLRTNYIFNKDILNNIDYYDYCLLVGFNVQKEQPIFESILKRQKSSKLIVNSIGCDINLLYSKTYGTTIFDFFRLLEGKGYVARKIKRFNNSIIILGSSALRQIPVSFLSNFIRLYNIIPFYSFSNDININDLSFGFRGFFKKFYQISQTMKRFFYLINFDNIIINIKRKVCKIFIVYQGSHGFVSSNQADLIFPSCIFIEKTSTYRNLFGELKKTYFNCFPPNNARVDWKIVLATFYSNINNVFYFGIKTSTVQEIINHICPNDFVAVFNIKALASSKMFKQNFFEKILFDGFCVDAITSYSKSLRIASQGIRFRNFFK